MHGMHFTQLHISPIASLSLPSIMINVVIEGRFGISRIARVYLAGVGCRRLPALQSICPFSALQAIQAISFLHRHSAQTTQLGSLSRHQLQQACHTP